MASFYNYFEISVDGTKKTIESIREAVGGYASDYDIHRSGKKIVVEGIYKISDVDDACEFAKIIARAFNGSNFKMEGEIECFVASDKMRFDIEFKNGTLTLRHSKWFYEHPNEELEECETYEEYLEEVDGGLNEEGFNFLTENEFAVEVDGEFMAEPPYVEELYIEY